MRSVNDRKVLQILGAIFLALIIVFIGAWEYAAAVGNKLNRESRAYVDEAVPAIAAGWSVDEVRRRATPEFLRSTNPADLARIMASFAKLGRLVVYQGATGGANYYISFVGGGGTITALYIARAEFENGSAAIDCTLRKADGVWRIQGFRVNSKLFLERSVSKSQGAIDGPQRVSEKP